MEILPEEMSKELSELWDIQRGIQDQATSKGTDWLERKVRELLEKVRNIVEKYGPETYTVSVGFPLGTGASFTWRGSEKKGD